MRLRGFDEISRRLASIRTDVSRSFLKTSLRRLAEFVADEVKRAAPVGRTTSKAGPTGGVLRRSVGVMARRPHRDRQARMVVGIDSRAFYWKFLEFGTKSHRIQPETAKALSIAGMARKYAKHPGMAPRPFIRPTWDRIKTGLPKMFATDLLALLKKHGLN
jgi:HK97 gp10 family phage protein